MHVSNQQAESLFRAARRRSVTVSPDELVSTGPLNEYGLPFLVRATRADIDLFGWAESNRDLIHSHLLKHGAILFRGFGLKTADDFHRVVTAISGAALPYRERSSPRTEVATNIYTSTDYPSDQSIFPHNEHSYAKTLPKKLYFWCETPAWTGGNTPIGDTRRVLADIDPSVVETFARRGWMYVRNFTSAFGVSWQTAFQTSDRAAVENYCREAEIQWEWTAAGLRTRQVRPALIKHPDSGELLWFNHATFFHISGVEPNLRARLLTDYDREDLPNNTYYGDGSPIEDEVIEHLREAYRRAMLSFDWQQGDLLLVDNILTVHARSPFTGPRRILVAMADRYTRPDLPMNF